MLRSGTGTGTKLTPISSDHQPLTTNNASWYEKDENEDKDEEGGGGQ